MPTRDHRWQERQSVIREILERGEVRDQLDLVAELRQRGFETTQSSVSRDLAELRATKVDGRYVVGANGLEPDQASRDLEFLALAVRGMKPAGPYQLLVKTHPGQAAAVAIVIDNASWTEVVGTVAGDDTLLVATEGRRHQAAVEARLRAVCEDRTNEQ